MILDLKAIRREGKDSHDFFFEYNLGRELSDIPNVSVLPLVKVQGTITLTDVHQAYIDGQVDFTLAGECTKCLKNSQREYFAIFNEEVFENNQDGYSVVNDKVDLSKIVIDAILINMPLNFLCSDGCKGICVGCGVNLNDEICKCKNK